MFIGRGSTRELDLQFECLEAGLARRFNHRYKSFDSRLETAGNARL
jgi:hypothetical protein